MKKYEKLENEIYFALERAETSLEELKRLLSQVQDEALKLKNSDDDYIESRLFLNLLQKDLDTKIKKLETEDKSKLSSEKKVSVNNSNPPPEAEELMKQAEELFYQGEYRDAIPLYEQVLKLEPNWKRAVDHLAEAENH